MTIFMEVAESSRFKKDLLGDFRSKGFEKSDKSITKSTNWKIAMPYEETYLPTDDNIFDAIYFCKFLYHEHSNVVYREAKTMIKEIKNCLEFRDCGKGRWSDVFDVEDFIDFSRLLRSEVRSEYGKYKPLPSMSLLSVMENTLRLSPDLEMTFGEFWSNESVLDPYKCKEKFTVRNVLNARGSMTYDNTVFKTTKMRVEDENGKLKSVMINQTDKCWKTSIINVCDFIDDKPIPSLIEKTEFKSEPTRSRTINSSNIRKLLTTSESLMPTHIHNLTHKAQYVSRAIHKNGRGSGSSYREIHVMNSPMRIGCFCLESAARAVRDSYHKLGAISNVMELKTKDTIAQNLFNEYSKIKKGENDVVYFDNADCSSWGPSMLSFVLAFHLCSRIGNKGLRKIYMATYKSFSQKIFKLPDGMIMNMTDGAGGLIPPVADFLSLCDDKVFNSDCKFLINPQGMGQGLIGSGSGLLQDDVLYLSTSVFKEHSLTSEKVRISFVNTSDDYAMFVKATLKEGFSPIQNMSEHTNCVLKIQNMSGITRNKKKSTKSGHKSEFNSIYRTVNGCFNSELKIRNSFVECPFDYDYASMATWACEQSKEALRKGLGYIGASWIHIIDNHLVLIMGGMITQARSIGFVNIQKVPL